MTAPERGTGRTLVHPGGVEVTDAQALAVLCNLREALPFDDESLTRMRDEEGEAFVKGMFGILACLDTTIALHTGSIAVEDAALNLEGEGLMMRALLGKLARLATPSYDLRDRDDDIWIAEGPDWWRLVVSDPAENPTPRTTRAEVERCHGPVVEIPHIGGA